MSAGPKAMSGQPTFDVPTETYADHVILRPPNKLKERVAQRVDPNARQVDPVRRAEQALTLLENEFQTWMESEVATLEEARRRLVESRAVADRADLDALYRASHDIRGQAATFGYPLVGEVADGLCTLIEAYGAAETPQALIDRHVETIRAMVREDVRDRAHPLGLALARRLEEMRRQFGANPHAEI